MHECIKIKCFLRFQGGGESRTGPVAHPGPDVALWRPGAVLRGHRLRLQPPELAAGKSVSQLWIALAPKPTVVLAEVNSGE